VSPVLDEAGTLLIVELEAGREPGRISEPMRREGLLVRAQRIRDLDVKVLICGAVSRPLEAALLAAGIEVIPQTCGDVERVLAAFMDGQLEQGTFLMPGCRGRRRRRSHGDRRGGRNRGRGSQQFQ